MNPNRRINEYPVYQTSQDRGYMPRTESYPPRRYEDQYYPESNSYSVREQMSRAPEVDYRYYQQDMNMYSQPSNVYQDNYGEEIQEPDYPNDYDVYYQRPVAHRIPERYIAESYPEYEQPKRYVSPTIQRNHTSPDVYSRPTYVQREHVSIPEAPNKDETPSVANLINGKEKRVVVMIRNIPNRYKEDDLKRVLDLTAKNMYKIIHLPYDAKTKKNLGYAFIRFYSTQALSTTMIARHGNLWPNSNSLKKCMFYYAQFQNKCDEEAYIHERELVCHSSTPSTMVTTSTSTTATATTTATSHSATPSPASHISSPPLHHTSLSPSSQPPNPANIQGLPAHNSYPRVATNYSPYGTISSSMDSIRIPTYPTRSLLNGNTVQSMNGSNMNSVPSSSYYYRL
ncbi:hypothetical protein WA158_000961 [Blastocystis sp. Blastoise]